jgi:transcriptional regulator with XRE-family HTH domain
MYSNPQKLSESGVLELRRQAGRWLRELREARGLSQRGLAERVGADYYTFISQLEAGRGRIPPDRYLTWADALGVAPKTFVQTLLQYYDPITHAIVFGKNSTSH